jgi:N-acetylneuraminic acid mutarotase
VVSFDGQLWLTGGLSVNGARGDLWRSSDKGQTWAEVTDNPTFQHRARHQALYFDDALWLIAGQANTGRLSDVLRSDDEGITWIKVNSNAAFGPRVLHQSLVFDNALWVIGGESDTGDQNDIWRSDDKGETWTQVSTSGPVFSARRNHQALVFDDALWVIGGDDDFDKQNDVWRSDDKGQTWTQVTSTSPLFSARSEHAAFAFDNALWVIGGLEDDVVQQNRTNKLNDIWRSDDKGQTWNQVLPTGSVFTVRSDHEAFAFDNALWVIAGYTNVINANGRFFANDVWRSDDKGRSWTQVDSDAPFSPRYVTSVAVSNDAVWLIGGVDSHWKNDVWRSLDGLDWRTGKQGEFVFE